MPPNVDASEIGLLLERLVGLATLVAPRAVTVWELVLIDSAKSIMLLELSGFSELCSILIAAANFLLASNGAVVDNMVCINARRHCGGLLNLMVDLD